MKTYIRSKIKSYYKDKSTKIEYINTDISDLSGLLFQEIEKKVVESIEKSFRNLSYLDYYEIKEMRLYVL